jgi:hypothetical protein
VVVETGVQGRDHEGLAVMDEAEVSDQPGIEHGVDRAAVVRRALVDTADARALGRGGVGAAARGHSGEAYGQA